MLDLPKIKALIVRINTQTKNNMRSVSDNDKLDMLLSEHAEELVNLADRAKDGPSEEDEILFKRIVQDEFEENILMNSSFRWIISKLKKAWGIDV